MRRQYFDYRPRPQFRAFHRRKERFACIITHRRAGKTVACIHELQRRAIESTKKHPRFAYLSPLLKQSKTVAWDYLRDAMSLLCKAGATVNETELKEKGPVVLADAGDVAKVGLGHVVAADRISSQPALVREFAYKWRSCLTFDSLLARQISRGLRRVPVEMTPICRLKSAFSDRLCTFLNRRQSCAALSSSRRES